MQDYFGPRRFDFECGPVESYHVARNLVVRMDAVNRAPFVGAVIPASREGRIDRVACWISGLQRATAGALTPFSAEVFAVDGLGRFSLGVVVVAVPDITSTGLLFSAIVPLCRGIEVEARLMGPAGCDLEVDVRLVADRVGLGPGWTLTAGTLK